MFAIFRSAAANLFRMRDAGTKLFRMTEESVAVVVEGLSPTYLLLKGS